MYETIAATAAEAPKQWSMGVVDHNTPVTLSIDRHLLPAALRFDVLGQLISRMMG